MNNITTCFFVGYPSYLLQDIWKRWFLQRNGQKRIGALILLLFGAAGVKNEGRDGAKEEAEVQQASRRAGRRGNNE